MAQVREHSPVVIEEFNGLWARGDDESCPLDHFLIADNIQFFHSGIETRTAGKPYANGNRFSSSLRQTKRFYNYTAQWGQSLIVLVEGGIFYHVVSETEVYHIATIAGATDFAMIVIAGRVYFSAFKIYTNQSHPVGQNFALPMPDTYVMVYGDNKKPDPLVGVLGARPAAGNPPTNASGTPSDGGKRPFISYASTYAGTVTAGVHAFKVAFNGGILGPEAPAIVNSIDGKAVELINIPIGPAGITSRTITMTKANTPDVYYTVATIPDNTTKNFRVSIADAGLTTVYAPGAGIAPVTSALIVQQSTVDGFCDLGFHLVAVVYETNTGYLTALGPEFYGGNTYTDEKKGVKISGIPTSTDFYVVKRHLVSTKAITDYNGDQKGYQFFFIPKGTLENNTATELTVNYYDSDLLADASHLIDNFSKIPACVNFCEYHARMVMVCDRNYPKKVDGTPDTTKPDNQSIAWVSAPGEPEAVSQVDGLLITPLDGTPLTNCQDFRDNLYLFKQNRTYVYSDNGEEPSSWVMEVLDQGIGAPVHGIAEVLDSGGVNMDYLIIADWSGLMLFNGTYARPELSWKIEDLWMRFDKNSYHNLQIVNDSIRKKIWIVHPNALGILLLADYGNGLNPKDIRWARWDFAGANITALALMRTDLLVLSTWQPTDPF